MGPGQRIDWLRQNRMDRAENTVPPGMPGAEWQARCDLAAVYRITHLLGWTDLINTHISTRIPGEPDLFLINRHGQTFDEITASSLARVGLDDDSADAGGPSKAGFTIHSSCYIARADAMCILHTHTRAGSAISMIKRGIRPINQDSIHVLDDIAYHPYDVPGSAEEAEAFQRSVSANNCVVLMNHGLLTLAPSIHSCVYLHYRLERACQQEMSARMMNVEPVFIDEAVIRKAADYMPKHRAHPDYGRKEFEALVRMVDRTGPPYRC